MQNGPQNGAVFAGKLRTRSPTHAGAAGPTIRPRLPCRLRELPQATPPTLDRAETCPGDRGGQPRAHPAKISGAENHGGPGPASRVPAHTLTGRERETRTQSAGAIARTQHAAQGYGSRSNGLTLDSCAAGRGEAPRPRPRRPQQPSAEIPPRKIFTAGGPYKVPARAAHVIPRRLSPQANRTHAHRPARRRFLPYRPGDLRQQTPPAKKRGFPLFAQIGGVPGQSSETHAHALPPCPRRRETPPPPLENFRALAYMPRVASNARIFPRSAARSGTRSDRPRAYMARTAPKNTGLRCAKRPRDL